MNFLFIVIGLALLIYGGDWLLKAAISISFKFNISRIVIGMTIVSFATSAPELIVSVKSALEGFSDLSFGNVIGSNIANIGLVLALTVCLGGIDTEKSFYKLDWPVMMISSLLLFVFIKFDKTLNTYEGFILFTFLSIFIVYLLFYHNKTNATNFDTEQDFSEENLSVLKTTFFLVMGGVGLWGGSELLINGSVGLAKNFGISERVIAVSMVSIGTSIPELAASIIAVIKKEKSISIGNLIGSNIFNILAVIGITSIITPVSVNDLKIINNDIYWMLGISFIILPLSFLPKKMNFGFKEGIFLLALYLVFICQTVYN